MHPQAESPSGAQVEIGQCVLARFSAERYSVPYIVLSYYERYALALLGVNVLLMLWAADRLFELLRRQGETDAGKAGRPPENAAPTVVFAH